MNQKPRPITREEITSAVIRLKAIAEVLRSGQSATIMRLLVIKPLCEAPRTASRFGPYLAERAAKRAKGRLRPLVMNAARVREQGF